eukprot:TRINITY_DN76853_c0_g1_i1.p1 TRINITY_DN76853_c0_g1~~TRINITY_DN76853_c0_g1_i1.p1  ORF type:complete len:569 (-),score=176.22 TRINITY_DN76853_c0_g1_i1:54-1760(-)
MPSVGPSLAEVAAAKLREAKRLVRLQRAYDAEQVAEDAQALFQRLGDPKGESAAIRVLVSSATLEERLDEAAVLAEEELARAKESNNMESQAMMLHGLVEVRLAEGKPLQALEQAKAAEKLHLALQDKKGAGELMLLVARAHLDCGEAQESLNAALQAIDLFAKADEGRGEADAWSAVLDARLALGKYEDGLRAAEAALVIYIEHHDELGQALGLWKISKAHLVSSQPLKARKAAEKALSLFQVLSSDALAACALEVLVDAMILLEQRKEALKLAKQELSSLLGASDKWAAPRARSSVVKALISLGKRKEALVEAENALTAAEELKSTRWQAWSLREVALLKLNAGKVDEARKAADRAMILFKNLGDLIGEAGCNEILGQAVEQRGAFEQTAANEKEAEELIQRLKRAMETLDAPEFKEVLRLCYEHECVFTEHVEEACSPVIARDPQGMYEFFLRHQPDGKWKIDPEEERRFKNSQQFDRRLMYYVFRLGGMGYGPGFRLNKTYYRLGSEPGHESHAVGTLNLMEECPDWEEKALWHPGVLDCVLQVGACRFTGKDLSEETKLQRAV